MTENQVGYNTFYFSWHEAMEVAELDDEQYGRLSRALNRYCFFGETPELSGAEKIIFTMAAPSINASNESKISGKRGGEKSRGGGAPKGNQNARKQPEPTPPLLKNNNPPFEKTTSKGNVNGDPDEGEIDFSDDPQKLFLHIWQHTPDVFNALARIKSPDEWSHFWATAPPTCEEVRTVMRNVIDDVKSGDVHPRFIANSPDGFALNGGFVRHRKRFKQEPKHRIPNDVIPPGEHGKYFEEAGHEDA